MFCSSGSTAVMFSTLSKLHFDQTPDCCSYKLWFWSLHISSPRCLKIDNGGGITMKGAINNMNTHSNCTSASTVYPMCQTQNILQIYVWLEHSSNTDNRLWSKGCDIDYAVEDVALQTKLLIKANCHFLLFAVYYSEKFYYW